MAIAFARRASLARASEIRELLKLAAQRDIISFGGGLPPNECFPLGELEAAAVRVLRTGGAASLQYSPTEGCAALREAVAARAGRALGMPIRPGEVLITAGSQQGLDLTAKVFLDEGDALFCESPTYLAAISAFRSLMARFVEVPSDEDGILVSELARLLARAERPKFIYVIPDFQNPSGRTWSLERRRQLLDLAARARLPIVEDSPYAELRYEGTPMPSLRAMDRDDLVVHMGTFSKILSPGLRVGWLTAPAPIFEKYVLLKQGTDLNTSTFVQHVLAEYLGTGDLDGHIERVKAECRRRRDAMIEALERELPGARFTRPLGGMFLWVVLPEGMSGRTLLHLALERGVAFPPGGSFFPNGGAREHAAPGLLRLASGAGIRGSPAAGPGLSRARCTLGTPGVRREQGLTIATGPDATGAGRTGPRRPPGGDRCVAIRAGSSRRWRPATRRSPGARGSAGGTPRGCALRRSPR